MGWQKQQANSQVTWSDRVASPLRWQDQKELPGHVPSAASRLNPVVPQAPEPSRQPRGTFAFRIRSEFPFFIASGNLAVITSGITQGGL